MGKCCSSKRQHQVQWTASCVGATRARISFCYMLSKVTARFRTHSQRNTFSFWIAKLITVVSLSLRHNTYLQECTGQREPTYQLNIHDTKLLFLRFATEQSLSVDSGGGGRESNIHLIPYIIHTVLYVLNTYGDSVCLFYYRYVFKLTLATEI